MKQELVKKSERTPEIVAAEIRTFTASMLNNVIEIGRRLCEVKEMLPQGAFDAWVKENTGYGRSTAYNFMKLYAEYGDQQGSLFGATLSVQTFGRLTYTKALALLEIPSDERESFVQSNDVDGMSVRELQEAIRERDEARKDAEAAKAEANTAEESRRKMEEDLRLVNAELKALRDRPIEVAVERDEAAIEAARQEVREELQAELGLLGKANRELQTKLDKEKGDLQAKLDEANAALDEANAAAKKAAESESELRQELSEARKAAERNAKKTGVGDNQDISTFKAYFDQTQTLINKMSGLLLKLTQKDPETAAKLGKALIDLGDAIKKATVIKTAKEAAV